jgi:hypothetical protein
MQWQLAQISILPLGSCRAALAWPAPPWGSRYPLIPDTVAAVALPRGPGRNRLTDGAMA